MRLLSGLPTKAKSAGLSTLWRPTRTAFSRRLVARHPAIDAVAVGAIPARIFVAGRNAGNRRRVDQGTQAVSEDASNASHG